jgi:glycosyltransferase involved in cell wall biosynthesis
MKVAIVHYWLVGMRGGEKVVEALCELFPEADVFTHVYRPDRICQTIRQHKVMTTFISRLPFSKSHYQHYLPLMPFALEQLDLREYDLVISSESGPAKGVITRPDALHVCYCHTPMRYVWSGYHSYHDRTSGLIKLLMPPVMHRMRLWDLASAARVDHFIANSRNTAERIRKYYRRECSIVYPPVEMQHQPSTASPENFYLFVSQLVPYKGADVAIDAFNRLGKPLVVIGHGEEYSRLKARCGPNIKMLGWQDDAVLRDHYARCKALIFVADEDFGIVPVEAMSAGRPVIAFARGGVLETVTPGETGLFYDEQSPASLASAVERFEELGRSFDPVRIVRRASAFSKPVFHDHILDVLQKLMDENRQWIRQPSRWDAIPVPSAVAA